MVKISGFIIAKNEEARIALAINSVRNIVDEVLVIDSGSTDATVRIAESLGARVIFNQWPGYVQQKSFAESLCKHTWVLNIDADEELSQELQDEIEYIFASNNQDHYYAYSINFVILHRNDKKSRLLAPVNNCIRIYNKNFCSFSNVTSVTTHDTVQFNTGLGVVSNAIYKLNGKAYHRSGISIEQLVTKGNFYSSEQAKDMVSVGRSVNKIRICFEIFWWFLKVFFVRRYFVFGFDGFIDAVIFAFMRFIRLAKAREMIMHKHRV